MPPKARITRDMVAAAAFEAAREAGWEQINARTVSQRLNCSTQPVMYHFATIEELKKAAYRRTNEYHTEYLMNVPETREDVMLGIGLNYIRFAVEEPNLFRFAAENSVLEMLDSEELTPVISAMREELNMNMEQTREVFTTLALFVHGYASLLANNSLTYDENLTAAQLKRVCTGAVLAVQEETT